MVWKLLGTTQSILQIDLDFVKQDQNEIAMDGLSGTEAEVPLASDTICKAVQRLDEDVSLPVVQSFFRPVMGR